MCEEDSAKQCFNRICPQEKSCRYSFKFQRRVSLESSWVWPRPVCPFKMILVALLWPSPVLLMGSSCGSHRHAQLVDILAQRREVRQFSCCRTAGSLEVPDRNWGAASFASISHFFLFISLIFLWSIVQKLEEKSVVNVGVMDMTLSSVNPLCLFGFLPLRVSQ